MIFCGQCGLQLAPGSTRCPRCGATVEASNSLPGDDVHTDDATMASPSLVVRNPPSLSQPNPQPLILRPAADPNGYDFNTTAAQAATSRVDAANFAAGMPINQNIGTSYPGYPQQQGGGVFPTQASYPGYGAQQSGGNYPTQLPGGYQYPGQYEQQSSSSTHAKGRAAAIVVIVLGLLFILAAVILFVIQQNSMSSTGHLYNSVHIAITQRWQPDHPLL